MAGKKRQRRRRSSGLFMWEKWRGGANLDRARLNRKGQRTGSDFTSSATKNIATNHSLSMTTTQASCKVVLAGSIAKELLAEVSEGLKSIEKPPHLLGILANADPSARLYAEWTEKTCKEK